ncbi:heme ABC exporter ATP-binding protein CcmA [Aurantiacibacter sp. D1-12]|uniref:heme ABC exporter ATP-binding protein CcmA n=1 Tax=Aurantiacibacter sp. D1-12 TaxID=2993658 RepID=UPI00237CEB1D|nr:heme ABC exporter ATP-binding protein CcmA [Aurantiacibacter sp. D1-12]MDE1466969.1 heme ABC exporter ATP-binding protein CcmA [Aurantiacibacter sp. D1-12]
MEPCRLSAKDLACRRGERLLFTGLSLELGAGQALHVTGPNGTGKSSLIRIVAGLLRPFAGHVEHSGSMGLLDERLALDEHLPLGKALRFWEQVDSCSDPAMSLATMQIEDLLEVPVRYLSTGQRKRAAIARLLNGGRNIWLLDEPFNGLDTQACEALEALLALHCGGGGIALVASHQSFTMDGVKTLHLPEFEA